MATGDITIQQPTVGFGSYLSTILPPDVATACGALAQSFLQVKNITNAVSYTHLTLPTKRIV